MRSCEASAVSWKGAEVVCNRELLNMQQGLEESGERGFCYVSFFFKYIFLGIIVLLLLEVIRLLFAKCSGVLQGTLRT